MAGLEKHDFYCSDQDTVIYDDQRKVKAATFPKLITFLTDAKGVDNALVHDFLLTYRSFATAEDLAAALMARYRTADPSEQALVRVRCLNIIKLWILKYWFDFRNEPANAERVLEFLNSIISGDDVNSSKTASNIKEALLRQLSEAGQPKRSTVAFKLPPPKPFIPKDNYVPLLECNTEEIARQLTLIEWNIWKEIQPWECLGLAWTKKDKEERSPHVLALIERFNYVSGWVATTMCLEEKLSDRVKLLKKFIDIAVKLRQIGNFNGLLEIISGLNRGPVFRLKQTFEQLDQKDNKRFLQLEELKMITNRERNYAELRRAFKGMEPPIIPYLGIYLTDLTFIEEGNKDEINGLVNFYKRRLIAETIKELQTFQLQEYNFIEVPIIQEKLRGETILSEDELYQLSEYLEPRAGRERGPRPNALGGPIAAVDDVSASSRVSSTPTFPRTALGGQDEPGKFDLEYKKSWQVFYVLDQPSNIVLAPNGSLIAATLPKIVERVTHHVSPDSSFTIPFLVTYRTVATPDELLSLVLARMDLPEPLNKDPAEIARWAAQFRDPITARACNLLKHWVTYHWSDFADDDVLKQMMEDFFEGPLVKNIPPSLVDGIKSVYRRNEAIHQDPRLLLENAPPSILPSPTVEFDSCTILDFDPVEVARQLALLSFKFVSLIRPEDIIGVNLANFLDPSQNQRDKKNKKAIEDFTASISSWVDEEFQIALQHNTMSHVIGHFIQVAQTCLQINNFYACRELFLALNSAIDRQFEADPIAMPNAMSRLSQTDRMTFFEMKELFSPKASQRLMSMMEKANSPAILIVQEFQNRVQQVEKIHPKEYTTESMINCEKKRALGEILFVFSRHRSPYGFHPVPVIQKYLGRPRISGQVPPTIKISARWSAPPSRPAPAIPTASAEHKRAVSAKDAASLRDMMIDFVLYDPAFKEELAGIVREVMQEEMAKFSEDMRRMAITGAFGPLNGETQSLCGLGPFAHIIDDKVRGVLEKTFPRSTLTTWAHYDELGLLNGKPEQINVDIIHKDGNKYMLGIKETVTVAELDLFLKLGNMYKLQNPSTPIACVIVTFAVTPEAEELAKKYKIRLLKV